MRLVLALIVQFLFSGVVLGSTFIGNGGNMLDPALRMTLRDMAVALDYADFEPETLCLCKGQSVQCALIKELNEKQAAFCKQFLIDNIDTLKAMLKPGSGLSHVWTEGGIKEHRQHRQSDAIAQTESKRILLDPDKFKSLDEAARLQLLVHEYGHFLVWDGQPIRDHGTVGPFEGGEGGRQFLDTLGAAVVLAGMRAKVIPLSPSTYSSPAYKWRIGAALSTLTLNDSYRRQSFSANSDAAREVYSFSYFPRVVGNFGIGYRYVKGVLEESNVRNLGITSSMKIDQHVLGFEWRGILLPWEHGTYLSRILFSVYCGGGYGKVSHKIKDGFNEMTGSAKVVSGVVDLAVRLPVVGGVFVDLSLGLDHSPYKIDTLGIRQNSISTSRTFGVSYGF